MLTASAFLLPSVPTMLIDEQRGDVTEMIEAVEAAGVRLAAESPAAIVVVSARWSTPGPFQADDARRHRSMVDLPGFGVEPRFDCDGHPTLARTIVEQATRLGLRATTARRGVDSGINVPLHFLAKGRRLPVVPLSIGEGGPEEHRAWGAAIRVALEAWPERVAFAVGGALSWHLHAFNLHREVPECADLDERVLGALRRGAWGELEPIVRRLGEKAHPEASLRHLEVLRGFLRDETTAGTVHEHERSPGIGTALVEFAVAAAHGGAGR
jgi:aromatic ring-opening dioxygenase catalytic subunit (LigB family)